MTREAVIEAIRHEHPWVSTERCDDLMAYAQQILGLEAMPMECGRVVLGMVERQSYPDDPCGNVENT